MRPVDDQRANYDDRPETPGAAPVRALVRWSPRTRRRIMGVVIGLLTLAAVWAIWGVLGIRQAAFRMNSTSSLKQIGLAIHNYHETYGELPKNTYSPDGKPLLSWRVHILPFIEEDRLHSQFHLDEPWDSPHNLRLLDRMPATYAHPADRRGHRGHRTFYRGFSSPGAAFERRPGDHRLKPDEKYAPFTLKDFGDGPSNTILVVEAGAAVEWTRPDDLDAGAGKPFPPMGGMGWRRAFQVLMADGSVRSMRLDTADAVLRAWITHSGGEPPPAD